MVFPDPYIDKCFNDGEDTLISSFPLLRMEVFFLNLIVNVRPLTEVSINQLYCRGHKSERWGRCFVYKQYPNYSSILFGRMNRLYIFSDVVGTSTDLLSLRTGCDAE